MLASKSSTVCHLVSGLKNTKEKFKAEALKRYSVAYPFYSR
jgi:hypothetical protein